MSKPTRYHMYWQGKSKRVKAAVEDYLTSGKSVKEIAEKHGVSQVALANNSKMIRHLYHKGLVKLNEITGDSK